MIVEYKNRNSVSFSTLEDGDCFVVDGNVFMRTSNARELCGDGTLNAVLLEGGIMCAFEDWESVNLKDAKVVIE